MGRFELVYAGEMATCLLIFHTEIPASSARHSDTHLLLFHFVPLIILQSFSTCSLLRRRPLRPLGWLNWSTELAQVMSLMARTSLADGFPASSAPYWLSPPLLSRCLYGHKMTSSQLTVRPSCEGSFRYKWSSVFFPENQERQIGGILFGHRWASRWHVCVFMWHYRRSWHTRVCGRVWHAAL